MKYFFTIIISILITAIQAQSFYDMDQIQTIEVNFAESNWDQLMDNAYAADSGYILAESVTINGITFDSIGVKYKGNSSYRSNQVKNPWHIELDTYKDHEYDGYTDIKLANGAKDPSMIRDVLAYNVIRQYMDAPLANFANLYVNGELIGLYANTESISKKFMNSRFGSKENTRFKCSPPGGAGPQSTDLPNLVYLGQDSTDYYEGYELKSDEGWQDLIDLCDTLVNHTDGIEKILDVNRALWMIAFDNVIVNLDSYIGNFSQNYYLYRSDYGQFLPVVWDLNESFGVFSSTGSGNLNGTTIKQRMSHLLHENNEDYPLIQELLSVPTYRRMYLAHMKTILQENFVDGSYLATGEALQTTIDDAVQADNNKFFTYNNFVANLTTDVSGGGGGPGGGSSTPGISNLMDGRVEYLLGLNDFITVEPAISDISLSNSTPQVQESISITALVSDGTTVYIGYRNSATTAPFTRVEMFDDGMHNDGAANDGIYGTTLTLNSRTTDYYIYAENDNIGMFSPRRAEFEFYSINATSSTSVDGVAINEFMASNDVTVADPDGEFEDWIELYNNSTETVDLSGYFLTDDGTDPAQWTFPDGTSIAPGAYLIIWADEDEDQEGLHANFKLSSSGESIILSDTDGDIVDSIDYPEQTTDVSYARIPNGTGDFTEAIATFGSNNDVTTDCTNLGGDMDNDGVCADEDCDDGDASVGAIQAEGTACDDGDTTTEDDVILADGCTCAGKAIELSDVVINEFMASNDNTVADPDGEFEDWIELYNNGADAVDLSGYFLSDDGSEPTKWTFPTGTIIEADDYLIIWADEDLDQEGLHADFKLSASGESIILSNATDTSIVDAIDYPEQETDITYGRFPNGTGDFDFLNPSFNGTNQIMTSTDEELSSDENLILYPNPADNYFYLQNNGDDPKEQIVTVYSTTGQVVYQDKMRSHLQVDIENWTPGIYLVSIEGTLLKVIIQ